MNLSEWTARMLEAQADIIRIAQQHQEEHDVHHISMHTAERTEYPINSYVLVQYENPEHKPPSKNAFKFTRSISSGQLHRFHICSKKSSY